MADDELVIFEYREDNSTGKKLVGGLKDIYAGALKLLDGATFKTEEVVFEKDEEAALTVGPGIEHFEATIDALYVSPPKTDDFREILKFVDLKSANLKVISDDCFSDCTALQGVQLPESLECIGNGAFSKCSTLNSITPVELPNLKSIGCNAFYHCEELKQFTFGPNVLFIGPFAFCGSGLSSLSYAKTCKVRFIGDGAFQETKFSGAVALPSNLIYLGNHAFSLVRDMTSVKFPDSLKFLGEGAFHSCALTDNIDLGHTQIKRLYKVVFMGNKIGPVAILPPSLERCDMSAFSSTWVTKVVLPASIFNRDLKWTSASNDISNGFDKLPPLRNPPQVRTVVAYETPDNPFEVTDYTMNVTEQYVYRGVHFGVAPTFAELICVRTDPTDGAVMLDQVTPTFTSAESWEKNDYPRQFHLGAIETQISSQCLRLRLPVVLSTIDGTHTTLLNGSFDMERAIKYDKIPTALQIDTTLDQIVQAELELKQEEYYIADPRFSDNEVALAQGFRVAELRGLLKDVEPQKDAWFLMILYRDNMDDEMGAGSKRNLSTDPNPEYPKRPKTSKAFVDMCR